MRGSSRIAVPLLQPDDVIPHLGKPSHWKQGRSAKSLADSWFFAGDIPAPVRDLLAQSKQLADAEFLEAWLERETDLQDGRASPSQTDILALLGIGDKLAVLGIEAKVDESFGPLVSEWLMGGSEGKTQRLARLCALFELDPSDVGHLRYQLFHRTAAAILEAHRFRTNTAILVIQSFCPKSTGLADAVAFFNTIGFVEVAVGKLLGPVEYAGTDLYVGWAQDSVIADTAISH